MAGYGSQDSPDILQAAYDRAAAEPGPRYHMVKQFTGEIFKVVQFRNSFGPACRAPGSAQKAVSVADQDDAVNAVKLPQSISRSRAKVLEFALCNDWDWFVTLTIDKEKGDRYDLDAWNRRFRQWLKDRYRRNNWSKVRYLLVPERHQDGAWHCHGFIAGIDRLQLVSFGALAAAGYRSAHGYHLPDNLRYDPDALTWLPYWRSFGYSVLVPIRNREACGFYVSKYITKDTLRGVSDVGKDCYFHSQKLNSAHLLGTFVGRNDVFDRIASNHYEFVSTGFALSKHGFTSDLMVECMEASDMVEQAFYGCSLSTLDADYSAEAIEADAWYQSSMFDPDEMR